MAAGGAWFDNPLMAVSLIALEFGVLHATPLGPMLTHGFQDLFATLGFEFAQAAHGATAPAALGGLSELCHMDGLVQHCAPAFH